jgi:hypothetical protein
MAFSFRPLFDSMMEQEDTEDRKEKAKWVVQMRLCRLGSSPSFLAFPLLHPFPRPAIYLTPATARHVGHSSRSPVMAAEA